MDFGLHDRVVLITGASRGLGRACALAFAAEGARLALCARGEMDLKAVVNEVTACGIEAESLPIDVTEPDAGQRIVGRILDRWGRLDVLVNNAGAGERRAFVALDDEAWQASVELNLLAAVRLIRAAIPPMRKQGGGTIVNVAAAAGKRPRLGQSVSNTTKAALINLTESLAVELAPDGIRVNAVCPGLVLNDRWLGRIAEAAARRAVPPDELAATVARDNIPLGRLGTQSDVAPLVVFLASAVTAGYITGVSVEVDGGLGRGVAIRGLG